MQEPLSIAIIQAYKRNLAHFLGQLVTIFDPDYFVLGGGLSQQDSLYDGIESSLASCSFLKSSPPPVYKHQIGDSAGSLGAALLVLQNQKTELRP